MILAAFAAATLLISTACMIMMAQAKKAGVPKYQVQSTKVPSTKESGKSSPFQSVKERSSKAAEVLKGMLPGIVIVPYNSLRRLPF